MADITNDELIQQLYVSYFNRPADPFGLAYWKSIIDSGVPITAIANAFSTSAEFNSIYSGPSLEKIGLLYKNMFNRTADFDGLQYWTNLLDAGLPFQQIVNAFSNASGSDREAFQARVGAAQKFTAAIDTQEEILAYQGSNAAKIIKDWLAGITDDASAQTAIAQLDTITLKIVEAAKPPAPTPTPAPAPAPPPPQYSFTAQSGATPASLSFINSNVSNQTFSAITGLSPLGSSDTLEISFNDGGNTLSASQTLNVGHLNLNSAGIVNLNTTNGVGSSGAATFSGITDTGLTSLSIISPSSGPLTLGTITPAPSSLINLNADNVSGFLTVAFANGSFNYGDIYSSPNIRGALGGGDYNLGNPSVATGIWLNGSTNIVRYASHTTEQQVYVRPGLTTNATIYGFGSASAQDYLKIDGGSTAVVVLDNDTHLNDVRIDVQGSGNLTITGIKGGDTIWADAPAVLHATATGAWTPNSNTANDGSASINANGWNIDLTSVGGTNGWTITNSGVAANLTGSSLADNISGGTGNDTIDGGGGIDTVDYSSALKLNGSLLAAGDTGITLTLNGSTSVTVSAGGTNSGADSIRNIENVIGTNGIDAITGDSSNNTISGGTGNDTIAGGGGVDTFNITAGTDSISDLGLGGADIVVISSGASLNATASAAWTATSSTSNAGSASINTNGYSINLAAAVGGNGWSVTNSGAAALITGSNNADSITGGTGNDTISGKDGNDTIHGGAGDDSILGNQGNDLIYGDDNNDIINAGSGDDTVYGGAGDDIIDGGSTGNDILYGDNGAEILTGGDGSDIFGYSGNQTSGMTQTGDAATGAIDVITDFLTGTDRIDFEWSGAYGGFAGLGAANADYTSAYNHAATIFAGSGTTYIVEAYGAGSAWTSVLFARDLTGSNPNGAIQIGTVGAYSSSADALAAIVESDVI